MESIISTNQKGKKAFVVQHQQLQQHSYSHDVSLDCSYSLDQSGWTFYFQDFDEATSPSKKRGTYGDGSQNQGVWNSGASSSSTSCERMTTSCKRRKTKVVHVDLDLEDTATSPDFRPKGETVVREGDKNTTMDLLGKRSDYSSDLRRKGLCLVPLSMLFNCVS